VLQEAEAEGAEVVDLQLLLAVLAVAAEINLALAQQETLADTRQLKVTQVLVV